ncbi:hypothetical protein MY11210_006524 [Beauveria gryllotalpidicola]
MAKCKACGAVLKRIEYQSGAADEAHTVIDRLRKTGQKRRASQAQPGDADDDADGQRRVKAKNPLTQSNIPDLKANKRVREASHERSKSRLMERESVIDSRENDDLNNREANLMKREADLKRSEIKPSYRKSAVDSREAALDRREASVVTTRARPHFGRDCAGYWY